MANTNRQVEHDPYRDWYQVYRAEVIDKIKHWPENRKSEIDTEMDSSQTNLPKRMVL